MTRYTLRDRYITESGDLMIRAADDRTGQGVDIHVRPEDAEIAATLWGGSRVPCTRAKDGTLWYYRDPSLMTEAESEETERAIWLADARRVAGPGPSDEDLLAIRDMPGLSYNQRWARIRALAG